MTSTLSLLAHVVILNFSMNHPTRRGRPPTQSSQLCSDQTVAFTVSTGSVLCQGPGALVGSREIWDSCAVVCDFGGEGQGKLPGRGGSGILKQELDWLTKGG